MTKNLFRILLFLLLPLAGQAKDADSLRVLWVGNSYTCLLYTSPSPRDCS